MEQLAFSIKVTTNFLYFFINLKYFASGFGHTECNKNKHTECNKKQTYNLMIFSQNDNFVPKFVKI